MKTLRLIWFGLFYQPKRLVKLIILLIVVSIVCVNSCSAQTAFEDSVTISRSELIIFAENKIFLKNCEEENVVVYKILAECNDLQQSLKKDINTKTFIIDSQTKLLTLRDEKNQSLAKENDKNKHKKIVYRNSLFLASAIILIQTILIIR
jgi:hypothetical protein